MTDKERKEFEDHGLVVEEHISKTEEEKAACNEEKKMLLKDLLKEDPKQKYGRLIIFAAVVVAMLTILTAIVTATRGSQQNNQIFSDVEFKTSDSKETVVPDQIVIDKKTESANKTSEKESNYKDDSDSKAMESDAALDNPTDSVSSVENIVEPVQVANHSQTQQNQATGATTEKSNNMISSGNETSALSQTKSESVVAKPEIPVQESQNPVDNTPTQEKPSVSQQTQKCDHTWTEVTETKTVIDSEAYDEQVCVQEAYDEQVCTQEAWDEPVYEWKGHYVCRTCGAASDQFETDDHWWGHLLVAHEFPSTYTAVSWQEQVGTVHHDAVYETVHHDAVYQTVHHDAVSHTETIVVGYRCDKCGESK